MKILLRNTSLILVGLFAVQHISASSISTDKIYHNKHYHFSFHYLSNLKPQHQFSTNYLSANVWTISAQIQKNNVQQHNVVELPIYSTTFQAPDLGKAFYNLSVRVGVSMDKMDVQNCLNVPSPGPAPKPKNVTINGVNFSEFSYSEGAMMKSLSANIYRTVQNNACYSMDVITYKTNVNLPQNLQSIVRQKNEVANNIVASFRFK